MGMVVNVCPAAVASAPPESVWRVLTAFERFGEWQGAAFVSADPPGPVKPGQIIHLAALSLGRRWPVWIEVAGVDPRSRWIDLRVHTPFGIVNHER